MGKATITHDYGDGKYRILMKQERVKVDAEIVRLNSEVVTLNTTIVDLQAAEALAKTNALNALSDVDTAIGFYNSDPSEANAKAVKANTELSNRRRDEWAAAKTALASAQYRLTGAMKRIDVLEAIPADAEVDAWCADYNAGLTDDVGTIETGRVDGDRSPIIYPAGDGGTDAAFDAARDGQLQSLVAMSPEAAFYNQATLPGANKWKPRYRTGEILSIDQQADTAVVRIDDLVSTSQNLDVNKLSEVTADVVYMSCNAQAFEAGDRVVVAFVGQDWDQPQVVGFESNPRACTSDSLFFVTVEYNSSFLYYESVYWNLTGGPNKTTTPRLTSGMVKPTPTQTNYVFESEEGLDAIGKIYEGDNFASGAGTFGVAPIPSWTRSVNDDGSGEFLVSSICKNTDHAYSVQWLTCRRNNRIWVGQSSQAGNDFWDWVDNPDPLKSWQVPTTPGHTWLDSTATSFFFYMAMYKLSLDTGLEIDESIKSLVYGSGFSGLPAPPPRPTFPSYSTEIAVNREIVCNDDLIAVVCGDGTYSPAIGGGWTYLTEQVKIYDSSMTLLTTLKSRAWVETVRNPLVDLNPENWVDKYTVCASDGFMCVFDPIADDLIFYTTQSGSPVSAFTINMTIPVPLPPSGATPGDEERYFWLDADGNNVILFYGHRWYAAGASWWVVSAYQFILKDISTADYIDAGLTDQKEYDESYAGVVRECFAERKIDTV